ncbi:von Willebrand factor A domain-containing protein 7-like [Pecten maximus]|uniref:von Willebrand factor A domain-containing protein 7-like n=1 Tax=Pecten maximus TaxID=6579 RepID=UPI0014586C57|nr:von Willebrand factor A domain-containing protein 7-like [Pecten maximus]
MYILCLAVVTMSALTDAFNPNAGLSDDRNMYTHQRITLEALDRVAAHFLSSSGLVSTSRITEYDFVIKEHFGADTNSYENYKMKARQFADAVSSVYQTYRLDPDYTVNSERIEEAHILVKDTRMEITSLLLTGMFSDTIVELLRKKVGKCLMIIQSFYSNTNWVEMNGLVPYSDFGSLAIQHLMQIASPGEATCTSCDDSSSALKLGSCDDNLLVTDRLTSGYLFGQNHSPKPSADPAYVTGKCSHGGLRDSGKNTPATGGINKETTDRNLSPHSHLHLHASEAAIRATVEFLIHPTSGIFIDVAQDIISKIIGLQLKSTTSLGFVVDVSGSMSNDIAEVKTTLKRRVIQVINDAHGPDKYVLATFNDPSM